MLTSRELEVFILLCKGYSNVEISEELFISKSTAKAHVSAIIAKLNAKNRTHAAYIGGTDNVLEKS